MKGILLAGGRGSRLAPATTAISKHLIPIFDKPLIYYSLSTLLLAGIREILVITTTRDLDAYQNLLSDGSEFGVEITYGIQDQPGGIPEALLLGERFIGQSKVCLALGDNVFHGSGLSTFLKQCASEFDGARIILKKVADPWRFGIAERAADSSIVTLQEKPVDPKSDLAITGLYFLSNDSIQKAKSLSKSGRGELEIVDLLQKYLEEGTLTSAELARGTMWMDTGTVESLLEAGEYVRTIQSHTGQLIGSPEEIAFRNGWITASQLHALAGKIKSSYGDHLKQLH